MTCVAAYGTLIPARRRMTVPRLLTCLQRIGHGHESVHAGFWCYLRHRVSVHSGNIRSHGFQHPSPLQQDSEKCGKCNDESCGSPCGKKTPSTRGSCGPAARYASPQMSKLRRHGGQHGRTFRRWKGTLQLLQSVVQHLPVAFAILCRAKNEALCPRGIYRGKVSFVAAFRIHCAAEILLNPRDAAIFLHRVPV